MLWKKINIIFSIILLIISCNRHDNISSGNTIDQFINKYSLEPYEYLFIIHLSAHNCISCLQPLENIGQLQKKIKENGNNTFIAVSGDESDAFWSFYHACSLKTPVIKEKDFYALNLPYQQTTPVCYFYDLTRKHLIYVDVLPREEVTFLALMNLIEKYSGILM